MATLMPHLICVMNTAAANHHQFLHVAFTMPKPFGFVHFHILVKFCIQFLDIVELTNLVDIGMNRIVLVHFCRITDPCDHLRLLLLIV